jgi:hypothetical protein
VEKVALVAGITMDTFEGHQSDPLSLHKYLYCHADPVNNVDPSGQFTMGEAMSVAGKIGFLAGNTGLRVFNVYSRVQDGVQAYNTFQEIQASLDDGFDEGDAEFFNELGRNALRNAAVGIATSVAISAVVGAGGNVVSKASGRISKDAVARTREWYRQNKARYPDGVVTTPNGKYTIQMRNGFPDFSPYAQRTVTIKLSGYRSMDFDLADKAAGVTKQFREQNNLVWHHHQKLGRMELVPKDLNNPATGGQWHAGGVKLFELLNGTTYGR